MLLVSKEMRYDPISLTFLMSVLPELYDCQINKDVHLPTLLSQKQVTSNGSTVALSSAWIRNQSTCSKVPSKLVPVCCHQLFFLL